MSVPYIPPERLKAIMEPETRFAAEAKRARDLGTFLDSIMGASLRDDRRKG